MNRFRYEYPEPDDETFAVHLEAAPSPFGTKRHTMLRIGIKGRATAKTWEQDPVTIVFVIDTSRSMADRKIALARKVVYSFLEALGQDDRVGIVTYGSDARDALTPTTAEDSSMIRKVVASLETGGSTFAESGIQRAFEWADQEAKGGRDVHLILISDGVANVGRTGPEEILESVRANASRGIYLHTVGVGMTGYNDILMEQLANDGDGIYSYVDGNDEIDRLTREDFPSMLNIIAQDARVQVEFEPSVVRSYRLLGYENRDVADAAFRDKDLDAGEVGAGHSVTALYEMKLEPEASGVGAVVYLRYQDPDSGEFLESRHRFDVDNVKSQAKKGLPRVPTGRGSRAVRRDTGRELLGPGREPGGPDEVLQGPGTKVPQ